MHASTSMLTVSLLLDSDSRTHLGFRRILLLGGSTMGELRMRSGSWPRTQMPPTESSRSMRRGVPAFLPIVVALILLPAIAFASPPDPSWIAGIYDGADGDDIVTLVYETAATNGAALSKIGPLPCLPGISLESIVHGFPGGRFTRGPRSPPDSMFYGVCSCFHSLSDYRPTASGTEAPVIRASIIKFRLS